MYTNSNSHDVDKSLEDKMDTYLKKRVDDGFKKMRKQIPVSKYKDYSSYPTSDLFGETRTRKPFVNPIITPSKSSYQPIKQVSMFLLYSIGILMTLILIMIAYLQNHRRMASVVYYFLQDRFRI